MKNPFQPGDTQQFSRVVEARHFAGFDSGVVHPVYSTFDLVRDAEWACRQFVLQMREEDEEGIGAHVEVEHLSPALEGSEVKIIATLKKVEGNTIFCDFEAFVGERQVAKGAQTQKILKRSRIEKLFESVR